MSIDTVTFDRMRLIASSQPQIVQPPQMRKCLCCQREFYSVSAARRVCLACRTATADSWRA